MKEKVYIKLQDGKVLEGYRFGASGEAVGELAFTTSMSGYLETITDPSFYGHIVIQTFPLIGNYGINLEDIESDKPSIAAYIVKEYCKHPSNFRSEGDIDTYLKKHNIIGVFGVDTRELTKCVRDSGAMNAIITSDKDKVVDLADHKIVNPVAAVSRKKVAYFGEKSDKRLVLWDFGTKKSIIEEMVKRGYYVIAVPSTYTAEEILNLKPCGLLLSSGPGDPKDNTEIIDNLKKLIGKLPIFGICLGHAIMALALGGETRKMKYGHRGENQPVKDINTNRVYITSQNHGFEVLADSLNGQGFEMFCNANDNTSEGMIYPKYNAFTVQFHPEACGGPEDTKFLFDKFVSIMEGSYAFKK